MSVVTDNARAIHARESTLRRSAAWLLVVLAYLYAFPYFERMGAPGENGRVWTTRAIVEHHRLSIDQVEREWGRVEDAALVGGRVYSSKAPGMSVIGVPVYAAQAKLWRLLGWPSPSRLATTAALRVFCVAIPMAIFLLLFSGWAGRVTRSTAARDLLVVGLGAGTMLYPHSVAFVGHAVAAALTFAAYMLLSTADRGHPSESGRLFGAGALTGVAICFEYRMALVAIVLTVYVAVVFRRHVVLFILGMLPPTLVLATYQTMVFGSPWAVPQGEAENAIVATHNAAALLWRTSVRWDTMRAMLVSPATGLLVFSPFLVLGLLGAMWVAVRGPRREGVLVLALFVVMLISSSGVGHQTVLAPFLVAGLIHAWPKGRTPLWLGAVTAGLLIPSVFLNAVSAVLLPQHPAQFDNPVFDVALPLLATGHAPYNAGRWLLLPDAWSLAPLAAILTFAVSLGAAGEDSRRSRWIPQALLACAVAALFMTPLARFGRGSSPAEQHAASAVEALWEPR